MSRRSDTCNLMNLSSDVPFIAKRVCNTSMDNIVSNDTSLLNHRSQSNSQENTIICNSVNDQYNVSTVCDSINDDSLYNNTTFEDNFSDMHADIVHDLNMNSLYNNVTLSADNIHNVNNDSSTCAQNLVDLGLNSKGFRIGHINIQSIHNKIDQIDLMLNHSNNDVHVFGLSETKLKHYHADSVFQLTINYLEEIGL